MLSTFRKIRNEALRIGSGIGAKPVSRTLSSRGDCAEMFLQRRLSRCPAKKLKFRKASFVGCYELTLGRWCPTVIQ